MNKLCLSTIRARMLVPFAFAVSFDACTNSGRVDAGLVDPVFPDRRIDTSDPAKADIRHVSVVLLLSRPEVFDGKRVQVEGWINPAYEGVALYMSREAALLEATEYGVALGRLNITRLQGFSPGDFVRVEGSFRSGSGGHEGGRPGLVVVTELQALSERQ